MDDGARRRNGPERGGTLGDDDGEPPSRRTLGTRTLLAKPAVDPTLRRADVETTFWLALDWSTYRSLTTGRGLTPRGFEAWLRRYYARMLYA
ncbi:MAG TPA: hypothetical protein VFA70_08070 [Dehalococcoidia bacterium]|nr:hypothetical protein [Dehalococcoidia bacterium]